jgi:hypothetical protein
MTTCSEFRESLLTASPDELRGVGSGEVARHVQSCPRCAAAAEVILEGTSALDRALASAPALPDVEEILRRAGSASPAEADPASKVANRAIRPVPRWLGVTMAAAASAASAVLLFSVLQDRPMPAARVVAPPPPPPLVQTMPGQGMAVMPTDNPDITVVWFF